MNRANFRSFLNRKRKGLALMETALIMPVLLTMTFALLEYGWMFTKSSQIQNASRHGARLSITPDSTTGQVQAGVLNMMQAAGFSPSDYALTLTPSNVSTLNPGESVSVRIDVTYSNITLTNFPLVPVPDSLSYQVSMVKEGP